MKRINKITIYIALGTLVTGILIGSLFFGERTKETTIEQHQHEQSENTVWTCSMHPQIRQNEPGKCPICGMDLIPLNNESGSDENPMAVSMSPVAMQLANVQTSVVTKQKPVKEVRMTGKVQADERRVYSQATHFPGRIEQLMINYTGEEVQKGQTLALVYSPELVTAQEELFEAMKIKDQQPVLFNAAKEKLKNWKLTDKQIDQIISTGKSLENFPILADVSGIVLNKRVNLGDYIMKGMPVYDVVDLSQVWILFDVYESDMPWVKVGSKVEFTVQSVPGETFTGTVSFIDPVINPQTRVAKARIEFSNPRMKLKPEMFVSGIIKSELKGEDKGLVVPKTAVMWTGKRSMVYIKNTTANGVSFLMREVTLGPALGDSYVIKEGLEEGEEIAVNGTFSIDAAAQLAGKPSMMNPEGGPAVTGHDHGGMSMTGSGSTTGHEEHLAKSLEITISAKAKAALQPVYETYLEMKDALSKDNLSAAQKSATAMQEKLSKINMSHFKGESHNSWMKYSSDLANSLQHISHQKSIEEVRVAFQKISDVMIDMTKSFKPFEEPLYIQHCPMANNNKGADWISREKQIRNPYFGESMLTCGEIKEKIK